MQVRVKSVGMGRVWVYTVYYPVAVRYTIVIWSHKSRHETRLGSVKNQRT